MHIAGLSGCFPVFPPPWGIAVVFEVAVVVKVACALALILVLNARGVRLWVSLVIGTGLLAVWCGHPPAVIGRIAGARVFCLDHALLLLVTLQVIWLSTQMSKTGVMTDLVADLRGRLSQRLAMAVLPAVIGFLPMPGGAIFSAPLVDDCDTERDIDPVLKARINYWFRHVWEYWWPMYPGVLLLLAMTRLDVWQVALMNVPLSLAAMVSGWLFLLRGMRHRAPAPRHRDHPGLGHLLGLLSPIVAVIVVYAVVRVVLGTSSGPARYVPMVAGVGMAMLVQHLRRPLGRAAWLAILAAKRNWELVLLVTLVRVYGAFIEAPLPGGDLLVGRMNAEFTAWGIPILAVIALIPFVCGMATGLAVGFVGASFPIVLSLLGPNPPPNVLIPGIVWAYSWGYMGMILSPVHVCLIVTNQHFETRLSSSLRGLLGPALAVLAATALYAGAMACLLAGG
ncbi:MAG: DUF401 family protein [Lentisphaeria bacterium]|nr:DUF401 family protein [Lentisphaeria bacterium]